VTKKEIVKMISDRVDETQLKTKEIVQLTFDLIIETLAKEGRIELRNFGVFEVRRRKARRARNPRTNQPVEVGAKNVVTFQPGKEMEELIKNAPPVDPKRKIRETPESDDSAELPVPTKVPAASAPSVVHA
jgi:integration host factor subunit beta